MNLPEWAIVTPARREHIERVAELAGRWAQELEIEQAVVFSLSIDMVESHAQRPAAPLGQTTLLTAIDLEPLVQQPLL